MAIILQIRVKAEDGGTPPLSDTTVVTVDVDRNLYAPQTTQSEWIVNLRETQSLGEPFIQVEGADEDQRVREINIHKTVCTPQKQLVYDFISHCRSPTTQ